MFKTIPTTDVISRSFKVNKRWVFSEADYETRWGISTNTDVAKYALYRTILHQFYRDSTLSNPATSKGYRRNYNSDYERLIGDTIAVISIPQSVFGEKIKRGSVVLQFGGNTYVDDEYSNLISSDTLDKKIYGNVFYHEGLIVITGDVPTETRPVVDDQTASTYSLQFRSTVTIYETEVLLTVEDGEFNVSQNPSALTTGSYESGSLIYINPTFWEYDELAEQDPTGSFLAPYITTIGLYDDDNQMVAVAKLAHPLKSLPDYPINFLLRLDT
jgi:hypothetical protein